MRDSFVELVQVSIGIAKSTFGSRGNHLVVGTVILLKEFHGSIPLAELSVAEAGIEVGQVTSSSAAIFIGKLSEALEACAVAIESLLEEALSKILLTFGDGRAGLLLVRL